MTLPDQIKVDSFDINIDIIGSGFGESILITIGKRLLIGIDCCQVLMQKGIEQNHFLDTRMKELRNDAYKLWIITHYHYDHFQSFYELISTYEECLDSVISPTEYTSIDFSYLSEIAIKTKHLADQEYKLVKDFLSGRTKSIYSSPQSGEVTWVDTHLIALNKKKRLVIKVHAANNKEVHTIKRRNLKRVFQGNHNLNRSDANKCSYIIHLSLGNFEALFLADVPFTRSQKEEWGFLNKKHGISLIKIAHHGSKDGTSKKLVKSFRGPKKHLHRKVALVCPYDHFKLPNSNILAILESEGYCVISSSDTKNLTDFSSEIQNDLHNLLFPFIDGNESISITSFFAPNDNIKSVQYIL